MTLAGQDALVSQSSRASRTVLAAPTAATMVVAPVAMAIAGFDTDGDGRTSRAELTAGIARSFAAVDTGHSGSLRYLDYAEWALRYLGDRNALPSPFEVDANGDDRISLAELQAAFAAAFDRMDTNHDGSVSRAELLTIREGRVPDDGRGGKRRGR
ncbi:EF-hand domain-containing protein [Sphingomonas bacterium]|uniref:EF-hand domain-containing protein n=1 Tax=Sphingomonas bacterium TaxID=1895847 RepID=UPI001574F6F5|nr:EF-hand domain-containing protein [Sphingomonas bacterium]